MVEHAPRVSQEISITLHARVLALNADGEILLLRRSRTAPWQPLGWDLPGGVIQYGEDPAQAALRETEEETGLRLKHIVLLRVSSGFADGRYVIKFAYAGVTDTSDIRLSYEHDRYRWVSLAEAEATRLPKAYKEDVIGLRAHLRAGELVYPLTQQAYDAADY